MLRDMWDTWKHKKTTWVVLALIVFIIVGFIGSQLFEGSSYIPSDQREPVSQASSEADMPVLEEDTNSTGSTKNTGVGELIESGSAKGIFRDNYDKLNLPGVLQYKSTEPLASQSFVGIGKSFQIGTTKNWLVNIDANDISLIHTSGPSIAIQQTKLTGDFTVSQVNSALKKFLGDCGIEEAFANDIFLKDKVIGRLCSALYNVDGESHILDCAIFLCDKEVYTMVSLYTSEDEEYVTALYRAVTYKGNAVKFK